MATLQAARAKALGLPLPSAKSWGLNRAIFYAAAKRGFKSPASPRTRDAKVSEFWLGDDKAYKVRARRTTLFTIGGKVQTPEDFQRQVAGRFAGTFRQAWKEASEIIGRCERRVLESQNGFYFGVYRPRRDELARKWNERATERGAKA